VVIGDFAASGGEYGMAVNAARTRLKLIGVDNFVRLQTMGIKQYGLSPRYREVET